MVDYKIPENIPFEFDPPKLGVSYSIMSGRWFGGMRMASGGPWAGFSRLRVVCWERDHIWCG
jgi:hypothetical protein